MRKQKKRGWRGLSSVKPSNESSNNMNEGKVTGESRRKKGERKGIAETEEKCK